MWSRGRALEHLSLDNSEITSFDSQDTRMIYYDLIDTFNPREFHFELPRVHGRLSEWLLHYLMLLLHHEMSSDIRLILVLLMLVRHHITVINVWCKTSSLASTYLRGILLLETRSHLRVHHHVSLRLRTHTHTSRGQLRERRRHQHYIATSSLPVTSRFIMIEWRQSILVLPFRRTDLCTLRPYVTLSSTLLSCSILVHLRNWGHYTNLYMNFLGLCVCVVLTWPFII